MASEKYNNIERYIFADVYNFFLEFKDMADCDDHWLKCIDKANALYKKYDSHPLLRQLVTATMSQLEHIVKNTSLKGLNREQWETHLQNSHIIGLVK